MMNLRRVLFCLLFSTAVINGYAQDGRELLYNFEILNPHHAPKPKVDGFVAERIEEKLDRGVVAIADNENNVYISWRLLKTDPTNIGFDVYRGNDKDSVKLNKKTVVLTTDFIDRRSGDKDDYQYWVIPVRNRQKGERSNKATLITKKTSDEPPYISIPLQDEVIPGRRRLGVADLDGKTPCLLVARGTYKAMFVDAYQYKNGKLIKLWSWDGDKENPIVRSQGAHIMLTCDVDEDGRDEIILGSAVLDDDGTLLWSAGLGHPDNVYVTDINPTRPGLEVFYAVEALHDQDGLGICVRDAKTGELIWSVDEGTIHIGSGMVADIDPSRPGLESFATEDPKGHRAMGVPGRDNKYLFDAQGNIIGSGDDVPPKSNWLWWDAGKVRQYLVQEADGIAVLKYKKEEVQSGFKGHIIMTADLFGDWREEIVTALPGELRIYSTTIPAIDRRITLLQDKYLQTNYHCPHNGISTVSGTIILSGRITNWINVTFEYCEVSLSQSGEYHKAGY